MTSPRLAAWAHSEIFRKESETNFTKKFDYFAECVDKKCGVFLAFRLKFMLLNMRTEGASQRLPAADLPGAGRCGVLAGPGGIAFAAGNV